jgi:hypothetical protein
MMRYDAAVFRRSDQVPHTEGTDGIEK